MTYFKLDIPKLNESISSYKTTKNDCLEDLGIVYSGLGYTESAWNDPNVYTFIEKIKRDKYKVSEYFNYLDRLYNEINQFKTNIDLICNRHGYRRNSIALKFDDSDIDNCKRYLDIAITYLNDSLNRININDFGVDFEYISLVYNLRSEIKIVRDSIKELKQQINDFVNSINNEIYDSKFRLKRIGKFDFNLKTTEYRWKVTDIDTKTIDKGNYQEYSNIKLNKINNEIKNYEMSGIPSSYNFNNNQINMEEVDKVNGLNDNLNTTIANENDINLNKLENVEGLNSNLNQMHSNKNNINLEEKEKINGLNQNLNNISTKYTNVNINNEDKVQGLNNNLDGKNVDSAQIKFDAIKNVRELNTNIYEAKTNNVDMNLDINKNINVSDNISTAKINETNIDASNIVSNDYDLSSGIKTAEVKNIDISNNINSQINLDTNLKKMESLNDLNSK